MTRRRGGFTLIELMFALVIIGILVSSAIPAWASIQARRASRNARDAFVWLASRGQMEAVRRGVRVDVEVDPSTGWARIVTAAGAGIDSVQFSGDLRADVSTSTGGAVEICYVPRGYAVCPAASRTITFAANGDSARVRVSAVGRLEKID